MRPDHFEGFRFDMTKPVSPKFMLSHSLSMVNDEHLTQGNQIVKTPSSQYELGANVIDSRLLLIGRVDSQGALSARGKYDFTDRLSAKFQAQVSARGSTRPAIGWRRSSAQEPVTPVVSRL